MIESDLKNAENEALRQELRSAYKRVFDSDDGKIVLADLDKFCGMNHTSVCEAAPDALQTIFAEGKRRVTLHIHSFKKGRTDG